MKSRGLPREAGCSASDGLAVRAVHHDHELTHGHSVTVMTGHGNCGSSSIKAGFSQALADLFRRLSTPGAVFGEILGFFSREFTKGLGHSDSPLYYDNY